LPIEDLFLGFPGISTASGFKKRDNYVNIQQRQKPGGLLN
jgi:hypothetical protein